MGEFNDKVIPFMVTQLNQEIARSGFAHRINGVNTPEFAEKDYVVDKKSLTVTASQRLISYIVEAINSVLAAVRTFI